MATVELCWSDYNYFSIWRNGKRKVGDSRLLNALRWGIREDASNQEMLGSKPIAYGPVLEWTE